MRSQFVSGKSVNYHVEFDKSAERDFYKLPRAVQTRLAERFDALESEPRPPWVAALQGYPHLLKFRVGDYRVIYTVKDRQLLILVVDVGNRKDIYRKYRKK